MDDLIADWTALRAASAEMVAGPKPAWPWDRESRDFIENLRRRDRVQGLGMRFAHVWHSRADDIRALVAAHPDAFARYHVVDAKGGTIDPTDYMQSMTVMPIIVAMGME